MRAFVVAILLLAGTAPAAAQYYNSLSGRQFNSMYAANADHLMSQMIQQSGWAAMRASIAAAAKKPAAPSTPASPSRPAPVYKHPLASTDFRPAGARRVPEQLAEAAANPKDKQDLVNAGRGILRTIEEAPGFRKNNVASAMTVLIGVSAQVLSGEEVSDEDSDAFMRGINDELATMESFRTLSAEKRTQAYDTFVVLGGFIAAIYSAALETRNPQMLEQARSMARDALARFGVKA